MRLARYGQKKPEGQPTFMSSRGTASLEKSPIIVTLTNGSSSSFRLPLCLSERGSGSLNYEPLSVILVLSRDPSGALKL